MKKWVPLMSVSLGTFMLLIDTTIVNVALPHMTTSLHASFTALQWVIDGYALALAALLLGAGSVADLLGQRRTYLGGLVLFALASAVCGAAPTDAVLVLFRIVQGVGGAALFATTTALLNSAYTGRDRGRAFGIWAAVSSAAAALGPIIGGALVDGLTWRWIFYVNLPICLVAIVLTLRFVAPDPRGSRRGIDVAGIGSFTVAATALLYTLIRAGQHGWGATTVALLLVAVVAFAAFVVLEGHSDHPLLDRSLFRRARFDGVMVAALLVMFVAFAPLTYTAIWLQSVEGLSAIGVGLSMLPLAVAAFVVSTGLGGVLHRLPPGPAIAGGMALVAIGSFVNIALLHGGAGWPALLAGYALTGCGTGMAVPMFTATAMDSVPTSRGGMASGAINTARQLGFAIGIAVLGSVFARWAETSLADSGIADPTGAAHLLAAGRAADLQNRAGSQAEAVHTALHHAALSGLDGVFLVTGIAAAVTAGAVLTLLGTGRRARHEATPHPHSVGAHT